MVTAVTRALAPVSGMDHPPHPHRSSSHTSMADTTTVKGPESPSLPPHQGCLFHQGDLVDRRRLELQRVLGGRGDLEGPRRRRAIE